MPEPDSKTRQDDTRPSDAEPAQVASPPSPSDRSELLSRARTFLGAPEIRSQDLDAKRAFLAEKGLTSSEIELLLRELVGRFDGDVRPLTSPECVAPTDSTADISYSPTLRSAEPAHRCSQGAHMAGRKLWNCSLHLLRAYPFTSRTSTI